MSQYPPNGYQWPGQGYQKPQMPGQQQYMCQQPGYPQDQAYPPNNSYPPNPAYPSYPGYPIPGPLAEHYALSQASFNHNATQLPGLGISSPPAASPAQSYGGAWGSYGAVGGGPPGKPQQQQAPTRTSPYHPSNGHDQDSTVPATTQSAPTAPKTSQKAPVDAFDDGELSEEGLFDDLYDPDPPIATRSPPKKTAAEPELEPTQINEASDLDLDNAFYDDDGDEPGEIPSNTNGVLDTDKRGGEEKQRSASYSPDLSPREIHNRDGVFQQGNMADVSKVQAAAVLSSSQVMPGPQTAKNKAAIPTGPAATSNNNNTGPPIAAPNTLDAAKKEAVKSVLRLVPYGVKYQDYIDEGFESEVIESLFAELGLSTAQGPASSSRPAQASSQAEASTPAQPKEPINIGPKAAQETAAERRARIQQRLAAVKNSKPSAATSATTTSSASKEPAAPSTTPANTSNPPAMVTQAQPTAPEALEKPKSRKEALLKQKMEQLQKARQVRDAQSAARKKEAAEASTAAGPIVSHQTTQPLSSVQVSMPRDPGSTGTLGSNSIPAVLQTMSSSPVGPPRKRPTAADLFEYAGTAKRPAIGQDSQPAPSLVIDVSGESDDEDVEMELEREDSAEAEQPTTFHGTRAFRDYPPLTDTRPYTSTASSVPPTPPNGLGNSATEDQYSKKLKEIEEMKRRIAEMQSKKPRKTPLGAQTPGGATGSPLRQSSSDEVDKTQQSPDGASFGFEAMRLPKASDAQSRQERRIHIASVQLPKIDAHVREKMAKLKIFQDKIAALQREITQGEAEKQQLKKEMEELAEELRVPQPIEEMPQASPAGIEVPAQASEFSTSLAPQLEKTRDAIDTVEVEVATVAPESAQPSQPTVELQEEVMSSAPQKPVNGPETTNLDVTIEDEPGTTGATNAAKGKSGGEEEAGDAVPMATEEELVPTIPEETPAVEVAPDGDAAMDMDVDPVASKPQQMDVPASPLAEDETPGADGDAPKSPLQLNEPTVALSDTDMQDSSAEPAPSIAQISDVPAEVADIEIVDGDAEEDTTTSEAAPATHPSFTSYQSPLQYFRSYRFHPGYNSNVQGGLKSLTYSSKIQPGKEFCSHELAGNECPNGASCQYQHFASLVPKDDQILVELGRSDDFTGETKTRYVAGLREVLQSVRTRKIKDFNSIASEIIEYRRQFLADPSKILTNLDGVNI